MAHISSIGAGIYSDLSIHFGSDANVDCSLPATPDVITNWAPLFATIDDALAGAAKYTRITNIREFPSFGTPPNIVNVPVYGQASSQQIQGQSDAPSIELTINYVPNDWASGTLLGDAVADGITHLFRFTLLNAMPPGYSSVAGSGSATTESLGGDTSNKTVTGNSQYFWAGKIEAIMVNPQLTDANTATLTLSIQSDFYGAFTTDAVA